MSEPLPTGRKPLVEMDKAELAAYLSHIEKTLHPNWDAPCTMLQMRIAEEQEERMARATEAMAKVAWIAAAVAALNVITAIVQLCLQHWPR